MSTAYSYFILGVKLVPDERKVQPDALLLGLMVIFFAYVTWLLVRKLIAWESKNYQTLFPKFLMKFL